MLSVTVGVFFFPCDTQVTHQLYFLRFLVLPVAGWDLMDGKMCGFTHCGRLPPLLRGTWFQLVVWYQIFQPRPETWWWIHWVFFPNCCSTLFLHLCFVSLLQSSETLRLVLPPQSGYPLGLKPSLFILWCALRLTVLVTVTPQLIITSLSVLAEKLDSNNNCQLNPPWKKKSLSVGSLMKQELPWLVG